MSGKKTHTIAAVATGLPGAIGILRLSGGTARLFGIDRDEEAIAAASYRLKEFPGFQAIHGNFHDAKELLAIAGVLRCARNIKAYVAEEIHEL